MSEGENNSDVQSLTVDSAGKTAANPSRSNRAAILLAGGRSSRFGSNKAVQTLAGKPLICHVVERVSNVADHVLVVIGHGEPKAEYHAVLPSHVRVINDELEGKNPLVGIVTGLQAAKSDYVAVLACDIPFVNSAVIELLFRCALNADAAIPRWNGGRIEPLEAVYRRLPTLRAAQEALAKKGSSQKEMISRLTRAVYVSVEDELRSIDPTLRTFFNVNTRKDMITAERIIAEKNLSDKDASLTGNLRGIEGS
jgi:molybdopterin-guanine dinucleotide biosynthesis protein A